MKYLKTFENAINNKKYEIGDYVLINIPYNYSGNQKYTDFINNNFGKLQNYWSVEANRIGEKGDEYGLAYYIEIEYDNIPKEIKDMFIYISGRNIMRITDNYLVDFAPTKKELKLKITANKYNL